MLDFIRAHRKAIIAAIAAVLAIFVDQGTVQNVLVVVGAVLTFLVPNDQDAIQRVYPGHRRS